jgi:hypothetical protein
MWIIPTHSSLKLLTAAFETIAIWEVLLSVSILLISIYLAWRWALRVYRAKMIEAS